MRVIQMTATSTADGRLRLEIPTGEAETRFEVAVVLHDSTTSAPTHEVSRTDERGWPLGYFERTYGSITDETFVRHPQPELMATCGSIDDDSFDARRPTDLPLTSRWE